MKHRWLSNEQLDLVRRTSGATSEEIAAMASEILTRRIRATKAKNREQGTAQAAMLDEQ